MHRQSLLGFVVKGMLQAPRLLCQQGHKGLKTPAISLQLMESERCASERPLDCSFSHDLGGMGELKRDLGVCELPSQYAQR